MSNAIYIFGSNGFIGSHIGQELIRNGERVIPITRHEVNLETDTSSEQIKNIIKPSSIVVLSAARSPAKTADDLYANMTIVENCISGLLHVKPTYILNISSDAIFSDSKQKITEGYMTAPRNFHGIMHVMRETLLNQYFAGKIGHVRPTLVFGEKDPHNGYGPNSFLRKARRGENICLFGLGEELRDHIYIEDVAKICAQMILKRRTRPLNAVSGSLCTFEDIAKKAQRFFNPDGKIIHQPRNGPIPHDGYRAFDNSELSTFIPDIQFTTIDEYFEKLSHA